MWKWTQRKYTFSPAELSSERGEKEVLADSNQPTAPPSMKSHVSYCAARARRREKMAAEGTSSTTGWSLLQSVLVSAVDSCHCPHPSHPCTALLPIAPLSPTRFDAFKDVIVWIFIYKTVVSVVCSQLIGRFPALHSEIDWRAGHRAGVSERAKRERKRCWDRIRCLYCPAACRSLRRSKRCSPLLFLNFVNSLPFVLPKEEVTLANTSRRDTDGICTAYGCPAEKWQQEHGGSSLSRDSCSGRHQTGTKPESESPFRRDSRNCWQPEEKEMSVCTRRPSCPEGKRPKSERAANRRTGERVVSLEAEVSALSILGKTFSLSREDMEANGGSTLFSRPVFRRTTDQERMATQWATALKSCSGQRQELDVETVTWRAHPQVTVTWAREHRRHVHSFSWREHTYIGKPQLSSSFSASILCSFSSQET